MIKGLYDENCILHSLLVCDIPAKFVPITLDDYSRYWEAVTGNAISGEGFPLHRGSDRNPHSNVQCQRGVRSKG